MKIHVDKKTAQILDPLQYTGTPTDFATDTEFCPWCEQDMYTDDMGPHTCTRCGKQYIMGFDDDECLITIGLRTKGDVEYLKMMGKI